MLPIIDFESCQPNADVSNEQLKETGKLLVDALSTAGFLYLKNSGISRKSIEAMRNAAEGIFTAPTEEKEKYAMDPKTFCGYVGMTSENLDPEHPTDYKEAFHIASVALDPTVGMKWPHDLSPDFASVSACFMEECKALSLRILKAIGVGMKLKDPEYFSKSHDLMHKQGNMSGLRVLRYPPVPEGVKTPDQRLGEHTDWSSISLLIVDHVGGLQVSIEGETYEDVQPIEDAVLLNIGDTMQFWTKGKMKSKKHRVILPKGREKMTRRSMGYFVHADNEVVINQPLVYEGDPGVAEVVENPITSQEYVVGKLNEAHNLTAKAY
ncbi:uncharacterized protein LOC100181122 isoform X2 [Ciona intestinalis]